jgi:ppGpp synthetase/RelA/SpoT-type nucleotidyltranferase
MTEIEFLEKYRKDRPSLEEYAKYISERIIKAILDKLHITAEAFFKVPVSFRLKGEESLIQKAFYRNKNYKDPYNEITDKIGGRIVVLLEDDANDVCRVIESMPEFTFSKDRDFERERDLNPERFDYKSHHYIVRNKAALNLPSVVSEGTPVEIQIRTLLQHAYSELTHDTIYKPNTVATPDVRRSVAKCMALIEVTDQLFSEVSNTLRHSENQFRKIIEDTSKILAQEVLLRTDKNICNYILDAYLPDVETYTSQSLMKFVSEYRFVIEKIKERSRYKLLYQQPIVLFLYMLVNSKRKIVKAKWPLPSKDLENIFTDLGLSYDRS